MNQKIIYAICGACILATGLVFFLIFRNKSLPPTTLPIIYTSRPPMPPMPTTSRRPIIPEPIPKNPLEDAYYMSKKMNKDTVEIKAKLCKTLNAKILYPDICK